MKKLLLVILALGLLVGCQKTPTQTEADLAYEINGEFIYSEISYDDFKKEYRSDFVDQKTGIENKEILSYLNADSTIYKAAYQRHYGDLADVLVRAYFNEKEASEPFYVLVDFADKKDLGLKVSPAILVYLEDQNSAYVYYKYGIGNKKPIEDEETKDKLLAIGFVEGETKNFFFIDESLYLFEKDK